MIKIPSAKIEEIRKIYDYWQIQTNKYTLNIYNVFQYIYKGKIDSVLPNLAGYTVTSVDFKENESLKIHLDNDAAISVSLEDDEYRTPEAFEFFFNTGEIVIG